MFEKPKKQKTKLLRELIRQFVNLDRFVITLLIRKSTFGPKRKKQENGPKVFQTYFWWWLCRKNEHHLCIFLFGQFFIIVGSCCDQKCVKKSKFYCCKNIKCYFVQIVKSPSGESSQQFELTSSIILLIQSDKGKSPKFEKNIHFECQEFPFSI